MPRFVDPHERRQAVGQAVWRVVCRAGLARASVRAVAEEAGLSTGSLRHYFGEQRGLQVYAFELIIERIEQRLARVDPALPVREQIEEMLWAILPVNPEQVEEEQVRLEFLVQSRLDPELAAVAGNDRTQAEDLARHAVIALRDAGQAPAGVDVEGAGLELLALVDGLAQAAALSPGTMPGDRLKQACRRWLDSLARSE
ncbi:TetR family transcriptional regulator C-terminal domain-containing protein [Actinoplanes sp. NEAU-A12]|uniref:TetR family transcriptional regulator C-terminal domain-containing protein n=1 Tax=Actinoplanes sandaracinus TaxID=3045177 RepID=A0ABT6X1R5_9ACTN|nr:TetR family transcriptional regulator C-terminal domain-containing protein [Actinoplanes sandaracinus]MDI6105957.1 TetR family transcriptional regulator C-terminal domain-containing protein [Actinoplanes sandaracinus]